MDGIFLPTVQHSGTWFLTELFKTNPNLHSASLDQILYGQEHLALHRRTVIHTHIDLNVPLLRDLAQKRGKDSDVRARNFYAWWNDHLMDMFVFSMPTVIPVRDPLLSIVSRQRRHPTFQPHTYIVDAWLKVINEWAGAKTYFVPVDRDLTLPTRENLLHNVARHCTLEPWPALDEWAKKWPVKNRTTGGEAILAAYHKRDRESLKHWFPTEWGALLRNRDVLQPFFEEQGYEELLWW